MNKKDIPIIIILILLMVVWMFIDSRFIAPKYNQDNDISESITNSSLEPNNIPVLIKPSSKEVTFEEDNYIEEKIVSLQNDFVKINITSIGGGLKSALLLNYKSTDNSDSDSLLLDFPRLSPLSYSSNMGLNTNSSYKIQKIDSAQVILSRSISKHINLERTFTLGDEYLLSITDRFQNTSSELQELENRIIYTGFMSNPDGTHKMIGESIVGVDSYNTSDGIFYWGKPGYLNKKVFSKKSSVNFIDTIPQEMNNKPVDWISCKNKFFAQILDPKEQASTMRILCYRDDDKNAEMIASGLNLKSNNIRPDSSLSLTYDYYIGPRDYYILKGYNQSYEKIREFETIGFWSGWNVIMEPIRISLNWLLIKINKYIPGGYGIAIILLTILMRLLFHPLHKKSMDSMKNMQEIQPELKALQDKFKKDPKRLQQETMELYKTKKVNPMGGCLPMFVQVPIFIALYTILRGAIELRYVDFLWIKDLSGPENLFAGKIPLPFIDALNILPILMAGSMVLQQKLTSAATAITPEQRQQQQIMMVMMPVMMLVFFYNMPSGLVLYWTVSNLLMIGQTGLKSLRKKTV